MDRRECRIEMSVFGLYGAGLKGSGTPQHRRMVEGGTEWERRGSWKAVLAHHGESAEGKKSV